MRLLFMSFTAAALWCVPDQVKLQAQLAIEYPSVASEYGLECIGCQWPVPSTLSPLCCVVTAAHVHHLGQHINTKQGLATLLDINLYISTPRRHAGQAVFVPPFLRICILATRLLQAAAPGMPSGRQPALASSKQNGVILLSE